MHNRISQIQALPYEEFHPEFAGSEEVFRSIHKKWLGEVFRMYIPKTSRLDAYCGQNQPALVWEWVENGLCSFAS